jgi:hypothetical protein
MLYLNVSQILLLCVIPPSSTSTPGVHWCLAGCFPCGHCVLRLLVEPVPVADTRHLRPRGLGRLAAAAGEAPGSMFSFSSTIRGFVFVFNSRGDDDHWAALALMR